MPRLSRRSFIFLALASAFLLLFIFQVVPPFAGDFHDFYTAAKLITQGQSPYEWSRYYNPVWLAIGFVPLTLLPEPTAYRLYSMIFLVSYVLMARRFSRGKWHVFVLTLLAPFFLMQFYWGQVDWLLWAGLFLPIEIGLWFVLIKPQVGVILALLLVWQLFRRKGLWHTAWNLGLIGFALALSVAWGMHLPNMNELAKWNVSIFPWGLPIGLSLAIYAFYKQDRSTALASGPLLAPYLSIPSWVATIPWAARRPWLLLILDVLFWGITLMQLLPFLQAR